MSRTACTILTLNICHDLPMYRHLRRRCELIAKAIAAHRPAVAALQEVLRSSGTGDIGAAIRDRVNRLCGGEIYRLDYAVADGVGYGEFSFDEGVALLSRLEPDGPAQSLKFARRSRWQPRSRGIATVCRTTGSRSAGGFDWKAAPRWISMLRT